jgi:nitroreductase
MDFDEVVVKRRSIRKFKEDPISEKVLLKVLEAGRWAPSASNSEPWRFVVITDVDVKKRIALICTEFSRKAWTKFSPERARYLAARSGSWEKSSMAKIPVLVVVCYTTLERLREELILGSTWTAIENMLLAATSEGLGSCVYTFYDVEEEDKIRLILGVPEGFRIAVIIQLGYSAVNPLAPSRKTLNEIVSYQHF